MPQAALLKPRGTLAAPDCCLIMVANNKVTRLTLAERRASG